MSPEHTKTCKTCQRDLPLARFPSQHDSRRGKTYTRTHCEECWNAQPHRRLEYRQAERARAALRRGKVYRATGRKGYYRTIRQCQVMLCLEAHKAHAHWLRHLASTEEAAPFYADAPWKNPRLSDTEKYRLQYAHDPNYQLAERMRRQVRKAAKRDSIGDRMRTALTRAGGSNRVERELGYTIAELRAHLEARFTMGMTWEAFAKGEIHIDHVRPQASFDLTDDEQWRACWAIENLQPLWARENLTKGARWVEG